MLEPTKVDEAESKKVALRKQREWENAVRQIHHPDFNIQCELRVKVSKIFEQYAQEHHPRFMNTGAFYLYANRDDE